MTGGAGFAFDEQKSVPARWPYPASKAAAGHFLQADYGLPVLTTNCSNKHPVSRPEKLVPLVIHSATSGDECVTVAPIELRPQRTNTKVKLDRTWLSRRWRSSLFLAIGIIRCWCGRLRRRCWSCAIAATVVSVMTRATCRCHSEIDRSRHRRLHEQLPRCLPAARQ